MSDEQAERIRSLAAWAKELPPSPPLPNADARSLAGNVGRWYSRAGGVDKAVLAAQQAMRNRDESVLPLDRWPVWGREAVYAPVKEERFVEKPEQPARGRMSVDRYADGRIKPVISVSPDAPSRQATKEHELTHAVSLSHGELPTYRKQSESALAGSEEQAPGTYIDRNEWRAGYLTRPIESDARLAEVKRRYAYYTGNLVTTPQEAVAAWEWYKQHEGLFDADENAAAAAEKQPTVTPQVDAPTLKPMDTEFYDSLPDSEKQKLFHRMPELVNREDRIRNLRTMAG